MRKKLLVVCGLFALVGTIAVAAVLGIAGVGKAASTNTCALVGTAPNCLTVSVFPPQLTRAAGQGLVVVKFVNQGSATATHTNIRVDLPANTTVVSVTPSPQCPASAAAPSFTCDFGNIAGFGTAKIFIRFTTAAAVNTSLSGVAATVTYAEGNGNSGTPGNDTFMASGNPISVVDGSSQAGTCTTTTGSGLPTGILGDQTTQINSLSSLLTGLPCTPVSAGVTPKDPNLSCGGAPCNSQVSFVIVPTTGTATLFIPLSSLPNGTTDKKFVLYWFSETGTTGIPLQSCPTVAAGTDTCIQSQTGVTISGVKYIKDVLTVFGTSTIDSKYAG